MGCNQGGNMKTGKMSQRKRKGLGGSSIRRGAEFRPFKRMDLYLKVYVLCLFGVALMYCATILKADQGGANGPFGRQFGGGGNEFVEPDTGVSVDYFSLPAHPGMGGVQDYAFPGDYYPHIFMTQIFKKHLAAIPLAELASQTAVNPNLRLLADDLARNQRQESEEILEWMERNHVDYTAPPMPARFPLPSEFRVASEIHGAAFDRYFIDQMMTHLQEEIQMALQVPNRTTDLDVVGLSRAVIARNAAKIEQMESLLASTPGLTPVGKDIVRRHYEQPQELSTYSNEEVVDDIPPVLHDRATELIPGAVNMGAVNVGRNMADTEAVITPQFQSLSEQDRILVQRINTELAKDKTLSLAARNIHVHSDHGFVTLRGLVNTEDERDKIYGHVARVYGVRSIDDRIQTLYEGSNEPPGGYGFPF
jgi:uncharacterized protein (DUF305 family)